MLEILTEASARNCRHCCAHLESLEHRQCRHTQTLDHLNQVLVVGVNLRAQRTPATVGTDTGRAITVKSPHPLAPVYVRFANQPHTL